MPTTKHRTEPAGEPTPVTIDPSTTPIEDIPDVATPPAPEPARESAADQVAGMLAEVMTEDDRAGVREVLGVPVFGSRMAGRLPEVDPSSYGPDAEPLREAYPLTAAEALAEVFRRVQPIAKGHTAEAKAGGYSFRGIDDVYSALHDLFAEVGLVVLPSTLNREREQRPRSSGSGYNYVTHVHVRLRFLAADGSSEELDGWGEGADTGDKSTGKAYSQAIKSALLAAFLIPTEASAGDDPDASNSDPSRPFTADEVERAERALAAARATTTYDELAGVRHRSLALLDVPVRLANGSTTPLGYLFDEQRRRIESAGAPS